MTDYSPILSQFEVALQHEIKENAQYLTAKAGEVIMDVGQNIRISPILISGVIKVSRIDQDGNEILLYYLNPLESCAMTFTCCMQTKSSEIRATIEEDAEILAIPVKLMDRWMTEYPSWKSFVMNSIQSRFDELLHTIDHIAFEKLDERLVHYLKEKKRISGSTLINLSHEQIASDLATSRVVVSRLLKKLEQQEKVLLYRNQVKLLSTL